MASITDYPSLKNNPEYRWEVMGTFGTTSQFAKDEKILKSRVNGAVNRLIADGDDNIIVQIWRVEKLTEDETNAFYREHKAYHSHKFVCISCDVVNPREAKTAPAPMIEMDMAETETIECEQEKSITPPKAQTKVAKQKTVKADKKKVKAKGLTKVQENVILFGGKVARQELGLAFDIATDPADTVNARPCGECDSCLAGYGAEHCTAAQSVTISENYIIVKVMHQTYRRWYFEVWVERKNPTKGVLEVQWFHGKNAEHTKAFSLAQ